MATATKEDPKTEEAKVSATQELLDALGTEETKEVPSFSEEQLNEVELTKTQINTINDLKKVMPAAQLKALIADFKSANLVKKQSGEKRLREATTEFTKEHAVIFALVMKKDSNLTEIANSHGIEVTAIPNIIREIKSKMFTILYNGGQINHDVVTDLLKEHATAKDRKKRDKKIKAEGNGTVDDSDDDDDNDDDDDDDANAGVAPTFTAEELAALEAAE